MNAERDGVVVTSPTESARNPIPACNASNAPPASSARVKGLVSRARGATSTVAAPKRSATNASGVA